MFLKELERNTVKIKISRKVSFCYRIVRPHFVISKTVLFIFLLLNIDYPASIAFINARGWGWDQYFPKLYIRFIKLFRINPTILTFYHVAILLFVYSLFSLLESFTKNLESAFKQTCNKIPHYWTNNEIGVKTRTKFNEWFQKSSS